MSLAGGVPLAGEGPLPGSDQLAVAGRPAGVVLPLLRRGRWHQSLDQVPLPGGGRLSVAPDILIRADARWAGDQPRVTMSRAERLRLLRAAWQAFATGTVDCGPAGRQDAAAFGQQLWHIAGYPRCLTTRWIAMLGACPGGFSPWNPLAPDRSDRPLAGPRDRDGLTLVALPGNTFTCLEAVLAGCLAGEAVWVRPSSREPVSAFRLVGALLDAGWPAHLLGLYPTGWAGLRTLVQVTRRQVIYGGPGVAAAFAGYPGAEVRGPVRALAIVAAGADPDQAAGALAPLVAADAGRFCTSVRTIVCLADPAPVADALARRLDAISLFPADPALPQCAWPDREQAAAIAARITAHEAAPGADAATAPRRVTSRPVLTTAGPLTYLAPTLLSWRLPPGAPGGWTGAHPLAGLEMPFPFATITGGSAAQAAAFSAAAGVTHHIGN